MSFNANWVRVVVVEVVEVVMIILVVVVVIWKMQVLATWKENNRLYWNTGFLKCL